MVKPIKKISLFLILFISLPVLYLTYRELTSINETEQVVDEIFHKQLESILFSVNQYAEDLARTWISKYDESIGNSPSPNPIHVLQTQEFLQENSSIKYLIAADSSLTIKLSINKDGMKKGESSFEEMLNSKKKILEKLFEYKRTNYTKIETLEDPGDRSKQILLYITSAGRIHGFVIDKKEFVQNELAARFKSIGGGEFNFIVRDTVDDGIVYSSSDNASAGIQRSKSLWIIPDYQMGISLSGKTMNELIREKSYTGIYLIIAMTGLMLFVAWFGYRNIKREVELAQIKSDFVSNVSHELRTPLALINMFAETLVMGRVKTEEKRNEYYSIIQHETERLSNIVNKILNFSKIEAGKWKYSFVESDLNEIVQKVSDNYKFHLHNNGFDFTFIRSRKKLIGYFDSETITEALINLIDNAVKYSDDLKAIKLETGLANGKIFIQVSDAGIGISHGDQQKVFDKFFRVSGGGVHNTKGTGLGLSLVKQIVEAHKGEITVESEPGKGTTFTMSFPL